MPGLCSGVSRKRPEFAHYTSKTCVLSLGTCVDGSGEVQLQRFHTRLDALRFCSIIWFLTVLASAGVNGAHRIAIAGVIDTFVRTARCPYWVTANLRNSSYDKVFLCKQEL